MVPCEQYNSLLIDMHKKMNTINLFTLKIGRREGSIISTERNQGHSQTNT